MKKRIVALILITILAALGYFIFQNPKEIDFKKPIKSSLIKLNDSTYKVSWKPYMIDTISYDVKIKTKTKDTTYKVGPKTDHLIFVSNEEVIEGTVMPRGPSSNFETIAHVDIDIIALDDFANTLGLIQVDEVSLGNVGIDVNNRCLLNNGVLINDINQVQNIINNYNVSCIVGNNNCIYTYNFYLDSNPLEKITNYNNRYKTKSVSKPRAVNHTKLEFDNVFKDNVSNSNHNFVVILNANCCN